MFYTYPNGLQTRLLLTLGLINQCNTFVSLNSQVKIHPPPPPPNKNLQDDDVMKILYILKIFKMIKKNLKPLNNPNIPLKHPK